MKAEQGKTTLINILLGLLQPTKGEMLVDGKKIKNNLKGWQKMIGYVPQDVYIMDDTIKKILLLLYQRNKSIKNRLYRL